MRRLAPFAAAILTLLALGTPTGAAAAVLEDDDAIVVINGDVTVEPGEVVEGVFIVKGDAEIDGRVDGDVVLVAGDALVSGRVDGDLVTLAGRARLLPRASVGGDLIYGDERPEIAPAARVEGDVDKESVFDSWGLFPLVGALLFWLAVTVSAAVLGVLLVLLAPRAADTAFAQAEGRFWTAVGIGAAIFIALPVAALISAVTLVGLPLAIGIGLALLPLAAIAYVTTAWALGRALVKPPQARILAFLAGLAILRALALVPFLGALAWLAAVVVGLGLLGAAITASRAPAAAGAPDS